MSSSETAPRTCARDRLDRCPKVAAVDGREILPLLHAILEVNPVVAVLLLGDWDMPPLLPALIEQGEPTEAADYVSYAKVAWAMSPQACDVLA